MILYYLQAIILGAVQGVTEFLPISSTAHLIIVEKLFHLDQSVYGLSFDMFVNLGTILALLIYFWNDLKELFGQMRLPTTNKPLTDSEKVPWLILLATIPVGIVGLLLEKRIESSFRSLWVIVFTLIAVGIVMLLAERYAAKIKGSTTPKPWQIIITSLSQILALVPGVSRSGITISTAMFGGLNRITAARYSFMLSIPITLAATIKRLATFGKELNAGNVSSEVLQFYIIAGIVSFITGYFTLRFLLRFYQKGSLATFAYYRFALAIALIFLITKIGA